MNSKTEILNCNLDVNQTMLTLQQHHKFDEKAGVVISRTLPTEENIRSILTKDARLVDSITYCAFSDRVLYFGEELTKQDVQDLRFWFADKYNMRTKFGNLVNAELVDEMLLWYAQKQSTDPLKEYLEGLVWDKQPRLRTMLERLFGVDATDKELVQEISYRWAISCIARAMKPGAKVDTVLVLVGAQGKGKSSAFRALAGETWFSDSHLDIRSKEAYTSIHSSGVWLWELAELQSIRQRDAETVKMFLSAQTDRYRPLYERRAITKGRRTVFVATTNEYAFLHDSENRRFWPVESNSIDLEGIKAERDQLWAEAFHAYKAGAHWWLMDTETHQYTANLQAHQEQFAADDAWFNAVRGLLYSGTKPNIEGCTIEECLDELEIPNQQRTKSATMRIAKILCKLGATRQRRRCTRKNQYGVHSIWSVKK